MTVFPRGGGDDNADALTAFLDLPKRSLGASKISP